eukprot:TRINITY_DN38184_c0_g1_i1.p1 TRINITY_DN38184_c0_g1~~TRINITY_DN38184_c0_g1_i1.p1  ORF type:complete len:353 (-),score=58.60 TRINITY_DN38184_c0_g1_i1:116-1057(-)
MALRGSRPAPLSCLEVPIRRTFIEYSPSRLHTPTTLATPPAARTAPAAMGRSIHCSLPWGAGATGAVVSPVPGTPVTPVGGLYGSCCTARGDLRVTYKMSPGSLRAALFWAQARSAADGAAIGECSVQERAPDVDAFSDEETDDGLGPEHVTVYSADAPLPSVGSAAHGDGTCRRCCFFPKGRCQNGYDCEFCHFAHEKNRPKNKRRTHAKRRAHRQQRQASAAITKANASASGADAPALETVLSSAPGAPDSEVASGVAFSEDSSPIVKLEDATVGEGEVVQTTFVGLRPGVAIYFHGQSTCLGWTGQQLSL